MPRSSDVMNTRGGTIPKAPLSKTQGRTQRDVNDYQMPTGPTSIGNLGPGLGGVNWGYCGTQGTTEGPTMSSGKPGLGGDKPRQGVNKRRA